MPKMTWDELVDWVKEHYSIQYLTPYQFRIDFFLYDISGYIFYLGDEVATNRTYEQMKTVIEILENKDG